MKFLLILIFTIVFHLNGWSQQILIKEDFSFEYLVDSELEDNLLGGTYSYTSGGSGSGGRSKRLKTSRLIWDYYPYEYHYEDFIWYLGNYNAYDSLVIDADHLTWTGSSWDQDYGGVRFQISSDSLSWVDISSQELPYVVDSQSHPHLRLFDDYGNRELDNLLVIGYSDNQTSNSCWFDVDQNGNIGAQDLLAFLEVYGTFVDCD